MQAEYRQRLQQFRQQMAQAEQEAALIFSPENLRYLFNYSGEAAYGLVSLDHLYLITDYRFEEQAQEECFAAHAECQVICRDRDRQTLGQAIAELLAKERAKRLWFEAEHVSVSMSQSIMADNPDSRFSPSAANLERQRKVKDAWEVLQIKAAAAIADVALASVLPLLKLGVSERDIALELDYQMQKRGSEGLSFPTILGFGARSALPHCIPSSRKLQAGDLVVLDFGAVVNGYRSDMTRSFVAGEPSAQQRAMYETVYMAQRAAMEVLHVGVSARIVNAAAASVLQSSPFAACAGPGLGHGVGLKLHEPPFMNAVCDDYLLQNYVVTIEPGIYIPGFGGVRIEDDVLITERGFELITHAPKQFVLDV